MYRTNVSYAEIQKSFLIHYGQRGDFLFCVLCFTKYNEINLSHIQMYQSMFRVQDHSKFFFIDYAWKRSEIHFQL